LFILVVIVPTFVCGLYYLFIASDRYAVQTDFIVRNVHGSQTGGLASLFRTFGITRAEDESYAVIDFVLSRDAVKAIDEEHPLRKIFANPGADWFATYPYWWAFWRGDNFECLYDYYLSKVDAWYQSKGGIITLKVIAFSAEDAKLLSDLLIHQGEQLINRMNERSNLDAISVSKKELDRAEAMVVAAQQKITTFRNTELMLDPVADSAKAVDLIASLTSELADAQRQLNETLQGSPSSPIVQSLRSRINALNQQIASEKFKIAGHDASLASKISTFERLTLDRQFADKVLSAAFDTLQSAHQTALRQQLYIETIVSPALPDEATEPRTARNIGAVFVISFVLYGLMWLVISASKEHAS
jgi:capsular polysaccharide transport system permease protein